DKLSSREVHDLVPRPLVGRHGGLDGVEIRDGRAAEDVLQQRGNPVERNAIVEEQIDGRFVGGIEDRGGGAAARARFEGQAEAGELVEVGREKLELAHGREVETRRFEGEAFGLHEGVQDGHAHVGASELRHQGAVAELHQGVDDRAGVHDDLDAVEPDAEQLVGLDHLQALVHQGGGIDGDLGAHHPRGVLEGIRLGDGDEVGLRALAERAARGGKLQEIDLVDGTSRETLEDGGMLRIDGDETGFRVAAQRGVDQIAGHHHAFLVGQADGFSVADGFQGGAHADGPDQTIEDIVDGGGRDQLKQAVHARDHAAVLPLRGELFGGGGVEDDGHRDVEFTKDGQKKVDLAADGHTREAEPVGMLAYDLEGRVADGAGGPEQGDVFYERHGGEFKLWVALPVLDNVLLSLCWGMR